MNKEERFMDNSQLFVSIVKPFIPTNITNYSY